jgi:hypothetical protein
MGSNNDGDESSQNSVDKNNFNCKK